MGTYGVDIKTRRPEIDIGLCRTNRIFCYTRNVPWKQEIMTIETTLESDIGT